MNAAMRDFAIREIGCIACRKRRLGFAACEKHHLLTTGLHGNGKRRGEAATIGLCDWHHRGAVHMTMQSIGYRYERDRLEDVRGPSYALNARAFRAQFGTDDELLAYQNELIEEWRKAA